MITSLATGIRKRIDWRFSEMREFWERLNAEPRRDFEYANSPIRWRRLCFLHDATLGWRYVPSQRARIYQAGRYHTVRTNQTGFRSDTEYASLPSGRPRIAVLGDSFAAGDGVDNRERFSDLLGARFPLIEMMNFALPGTGIDQQILIYEHVVSKYDVDAILFCPADMDIFRLTVKAWPALEWGTKELKYRAKPYFVLEDEALRLPSPVVPWGMRSEHELGDWGSVDFAKTMTGEDWIRAYQNDVLPCRLLKALVNRLFSASHGVPVIVAPLPSPDCVMRDCPPVYRDAYAGMTRDTDKALFVDVLPSFLALNRADRKKCFLERDPHYSAIGHQIVAGVIGDAIVPQVQALHRSKMT